MVGQWGMSPDIHYNLLLVATVASSLLSVITHGFMRFTIHMLCPVMMTRIW